MPQSEIIDVLLMAGWLFEVDTGRRETAETEAFTALESLIVHGLGFRHDSVRGRLFDPVEVMNFMTWTGLVSSDQPQEDRVVRTGRALYETLKCSLDPAKSVQAVATLERTFDLREFAEGQRLRLRCPVALQGPGADNLIVTPMIPAHLPADALLHPDHLEVRCVRAGAATVTIGARFDFIPRTETLQEDELSPADRNLYLRAVEGAIRVTPRVAALAIDLTEKIAGTCGVVAAFWNYMLDTMIFCAVRYSDLRSQAATDWVLDNGWCDCHLGSALLISLCRARGVPARLVSGYFLYSLAPTSHFWAEIWIEGQGWRPFDLLSWDLSAGGRDRAWRMIFAGQLEPRLVTQRFPLAFTGPMSVRLPAAWRMSQQRCEGALEMTYWGVPGGEFIYRETVSVTMGDAP